MITGRVTPAEWIPIEWPREWMDIARLDLVRQTPFNCLLCSDEPPPAFRAAAGQAGLECLSPKEPGVAWRPLKEIDWKAASPIVAIKDGVWPKIDRKQGGSTDSAGPTGAPWLDANGWIIRYARNQAGSKTIWIRSDPPAENEVMRVDDYLLAFNEAAVYGARRPVWMTPAHQAEIAKGGDASLRGWKQIVDTARWWGPRTEWQKWQVNAPLLVVSDFSGPNEYMGTEVLNLGSRRDLAWDSAGPTEVSPAALQGRKAVLWIDQGVPSNPVAETLRNFVAGGGLLLAPRETAFKIGGMKPLAEQHIRFFLHSSGKGRIAVPKAPWDDPYLLALDTHLLMSRRYDSIRLYNAGSINFHHVTAPDRRRSVVHLLNYARFGASHEVVLQVAPPISGAQFLEPGAETKPLEIRRDPGRQEIVLPRFRVYAAVELEHSI